MTGSEPESRLPWLRPASAGNLEYDRVLFFSDAIFAIAITLLVVDIRVPNLPAGQINAAQLLHRALPQMLGFGVSFAVIGLFWVGHHGLFRYIGAVDRRLILLNLLFTGTIAFLPYPTSLLSVAGDQVAAVVFYAGWVALAGLAESAIWLYACWVPGLLTPETPAWLRRYYAYRLLRVPLVFALSIPLAFARPTLVPYTWLTIVLLGHIHRYLTSRRQQPAPGGPG